LQAIENIYWWNTCCDNPKIKYFDNDDMLVEEECQNCGQYNPKAEERDEICPDRLKEMFGNCKVFKTEIEALAEAQRIYNEIMQCPFPIVEYGIQIINYDGEFPK
jgi:hypothetical protein